MCLVLFAYRDRGSRDLVLAANRDEFYNRPTAAMHIWEDAPLVLAGRDLQAGGTWLGLGPNGRFAAITNFRERAEESKQAPSRGMLVSDFLIGSIPAAEYLREISICARDYNGFNLLAGDSSGLYYYSNRSGQGVTAVSPGVHGLSNHLLDTDWPKVTTGKRRLRELLARDTEPTSEELLALLADSTLPPAAELPDTGVGELLEKRLSPIFIEGPDYGTRSSTVLLLRPGGEGWAAERIHSRGLGESTTRREIDLQGLFKGPGLA